MKRKKEVENFDMPATGESTPQKTGFLARLTKVAGKIITNSAINNEAMTTYHEKQARIREALRVSNGLNIQALLVQQKNAEIMALITPSVDTRTRGGVVGLSLKKPDGTMPDWTAVLRHGENYDGMSVDTELVAAPESIRIQYALWSRDLLVPVHNLTVGSYADVSPDGRVSPVATEILINSRPHSPLLPEHLGSAVPQTATGLKISIANDGNITSLGLLYPFASEFKYLEPDALQTSLSLFLESTLTVIDDTAEAYRV